MCRKTGHGHGQDMQIRVTWLICIFSSFKTSIAVHYFNFNWFDLSYTWIFTIFVNIPEYRCKRRPPSQLMSGWALSDLSHFEISAKDSYYSVTFRNICWRFKLFCQIWNICWSFVIFCHILKYLLKIHNILSQTARNLLGTALTMPLISSVRWSDFRSYNNYIYKTMPLMCTVIWSDPYHITIQPGCHIPLGTRWALYGRQTQEFEVSNVITKYCGSMWKKSLLEKSYFTSGKLCLIYMQTNSEIFQPRQ